MWGTGAVTELIARWLTQNLLEPDILFSQQLSLAAPNADADASESTSAEPMVVEPAAEAENPFLVSAEELAVIQGPFYSLFLPSGETIKRIKVLQAHDSCFINHQQLAFI